MGDGSFIVSSSLVRPISFLADSDDGMNLWLESSAIGQIPMITNEKKAMVDFISDLLFTRSKGSVLSAGCW
jgi:hypothetical protein